jgi:hypothetical protein
MTAAFTEFTKAQHRSGMTFVDFESVKANEIYDGIVMNGAKHMDASSGWGLRASCVWVKTCRLSNVVSRTTQEQLQKLNIK